MRWLYIEPTAQDERANQAALRAQIDAWWKEFAKQADRLGLVFSGEEEWDVAGWMDTHLQSIHPEIMWEFGPAVEHDGHRLVITPEGSRHLRPLVNEIGARAPKIEGWEFYTRRLEEQDFEELQPTLDARAPCNVSGGKVMLTATETRKIDCTFYFPNEQELSSEEQAGPALIALETLVGEAFLDEWIGNINAIDQLPAKPKVKPIPLERLRDTAFALADSIRDQLLPATVRETFGPEDGEWSSLRLEPEENDDYPLRSDLITLVTLLRDVMLGPLNGQLFHSQCHSRSGETFAYLKIDGDEIEWEERVTFRQAVADKVDEILRKAGVGCVFGGGTGLRYLYVDIAITDVPKTIATLRQGLADEDLPTRTWLLFFDDDLCGEWIGIDPKAEPPPVFQDSDDSDEDA
jgi:hypothetical protein